MIDLSRPITYLITAGEAKDQGFQSQSRSILGMIDLAVQAGISFVQLREKDLSARLLFEIAGEAAKIVKGTCTRLLINGRCDVAITAGADGVHLPEDGMPIGAVRGCVPPEFIIGMSVHSVESAVAAKKAGADYVIYGPIFRTPGKSEPKGLGELHRVVEGVSGTPVVAIGGIDRSNFGSVLETGASGFAAIRYLNDFKVLAQMAKTKVNDG